MEIEKREARTLGKEAECIEDIATTFLEFLETKYPTLQKAWMEHKRRKAAEKVQEIAETKKYELYVSPISDLHQHIEAGSLDGIFTDPPYDKESLPLWGELSEFAMHALKPGGLLLGMTGQIWQNQVFKQLEMHGLDYTWTICYLLAGGGGPRSRIQHLNVFQEWKPILVYKKPGKGIHKSMSGDVVQSVYSDDKDMKDEHIWGQNMQAVYDTLTKWFEPGMKICDPFVGAGSTLVAAQKANLFFCGADIDEGNVKITQANLEKKESDNV